MTENFPTLKIDTKSQVQEAHSMQAREIHHPHTYAHYIQTQRADKEKILN